MSRVPFGTKPWEPHPDDRTHSPKPHDRTPERPPLHLRHSAPSMLSAIGLAQPWIKVFLAEELLYLHPTAEGVPSEDPWVSGTVTLWLPKARTLRELTVRLVGRQDIGWPEGRPYETTTSLDKNVVLFHDDKETLLGKGEHTFEFLIIVPSSTASYERCQHGRVRHSIMAKAKGPGLELSDEKPLFLVVNPGGAGSSRPPPALQHKFEGLLMDLGPYTMALQSQHIMVGGLLLFRFNLVSPPTDIIIFSIKVKINQHFTLRSSLDPTYSVRPPSDSRTVFVLDCSHPPNFGRVDAPSKGHRSGSHTPNVGPLKIVARGSEYKLHHLARLPNDNAIRPSSQQGSEVGIAVQHDIAIEVAYRAMTEAEMEGKEKVKGKGKEVAERRKLVISKPLDIFSCCCFVDSLTLPVYSLFDPNPAPESYSPPCVCGMKLGPLILSHGDTLLREEGEDGLTYAPVLKDDERRSGSSTPVMGRGRDGRGGREVLPRQDSAESRNSDS